MDARGNDVSGMFESCSAVDGKLFMMPMHDELVRAYSVRLDWVKQWPMCFAEDVRFSSDPTKGVLCKPLHAPGIPAGSRSSKNPLGKDELRGRGETGKKSLATPQCIR
ncbi:hypothetical protein PG994_013500 [Apiospora phragmitis]|uniref:Uncharacterized protein n=1 Tax=Apiospora phragmitis TaxID=2905665 RepID=A0ABR1T8U0_9PEZI